MAGPARGTPQLFSFPLPTASSSSPPPLLMGHTDRSGSQSTRRGQDSGCPPGSRQEHVPSSGGTLTRGKGCQASDSEFFSIWRPRTSPRGCTWAWCCSQLPQNAQNPGHRQMDRWPGPVPDREQISQRTPPWIQESLGVPDEEGASLHKLPPFKITCA